MRWRRTPLQPSPGTAHSLVHLDKAVDQPTFTSFLRMGHRARRTFESARRLSQTPKQQSLSPLLPFANLLLQRLLYLLPRASLTTRATSRNLAKFWAHPKTGGSGFFLDRLRLQTLHPSQKPSGIIPVVSHQCFLCAHGRWQERIHCVQHENSWGKTLNLQSNFDETNAPMLTLALSLVPHTTPTTPPYPLVHQKQLYTYCEVISARYAYVFYADQK